MPNSVRAQTPAGRRENTTYVPPAPSEVDPDGIDAPTSYRPFSSDGEFQEREFARQEVEANNWFAPLALIIALAIVASVAYYLLISPMSNVPTAATVPSGQTSQAPAATTKTLPAAPQSNDGTVTPPADAGANKSAIDPSKAN